MVKTSIVLTISVVALLSQTALAQTTNRQSEPLARVSQAENSLVPTDDSATPSPTDAIEAKRLYKEAVKYGRAGLYKQAAELFERAAKLKPDYADAFFGLGHAYSDLQQWDRAVSSFQRAVELNPKDKEAQDRLDEARAMQQRAPANSASAVLTKPDPEKTNPSPIASASINPSPAAIPKSGNDLTLTKLYRVGPGDVLDVRFDEGATPKSTLYTVTPAGLLEHPSLTEPLNVTGLTVDEISSRIAADLKRRALLDNPQVSIGVRDYVSHTILVSGMVREAGTKILRREAIPLYVVVADAQPLPEAARVSVVRNETNELFDIELSQPADMNLLVHPGDVVTLLANQTQFFYVGGEVKSPGEKTFRRGLTLTQAIIAAGGLTRKTGEARLARDNGKGFLVVTRYKLKDIESGKIVDPTVQPGDRITITD